MAAIPRITNTKVAIVHGVDHASGPDWQATSVLEVGGNTFRVVDVMIEPGAAEVDCTDMNGRFEAEGEWQATAKGDAASVLKRITSPKPLHRDFPRVGRNDPCPCGSGLKYKRCCGG